MYQYILLIAFLFSPLFSIYEVGDEILPEDQDVSFSICNGSYPSEEFKLADYENKVIWLHFSASW